MKYGHQGIFVSHMRTHMQQMYARTSSASSKPFLAGRVILTEVSGSSGRVFLALEEEEEEEEDDEEAADFFSEGELPAAAAAAALVSTGSRMRL
jgi:predicted AAA+ superfamily ATPase